MVFIDRFQHFKQKLFLRYQTDICRSEYATLIKKIRSNPEAYYTHNRRVRATNKRRAVYLRFKEKNILAVYDKVTRQLITAV